MAPDPKLRETVERIEALIRGLEASSDATVRRQARELARLLMTLYGSGLRRVLEITEMEDQRAGRTGNGAVASLLGDDLIASLLILHDLHPEDEATRITRGLERIRGIVGDDVVLLGIDQGVAHVRIGAPDRAAAPSRIDLHGLIEGVVQAAAPDVVRVDVDGLPPAASTPLIQLTRKSPPSGATPASTP